MMNCVARLLSRFVVGKVLQTTETHDPFNDDFYFIQVCIPLISLQHPNLYCINQSILFLLVLE